MIGHSVAGVTFVDDYTDHVLVQIVPLVYSDTGQNPSSALRKITLSRCESSSSRLVG